MLNKNYVKPDSLDKKPFTPSVKILCFKLHGKIRLVIKKISGLTAKYNSDGLRTVHNFNFAYDQKFIEAYKASEASKHHPNRDLRWRVYNACWAGNQVKHLEGDYVECGVRHGIFSSAIMNYIDFEKLDKKFYLLDTFSGMVAEQLQKDELHRYYSYGESIYEASKKKFSKYHNAELIRGVIPDTLPQVTSKKLCYLSLDMNCVYPEIAAADYFWDKLVSGGIILMDDYAYRGYEAQMKGFDDFALRKGVKILNLPCGQGMIIKP